MSAKNAMPVIHVMPQLAFSGECRQAFEHYAKVLGGEITVMNSFGGNDAELPPGSTAAAPDQIRFAERTIGNYAISGNDVPENEHRPMRGFHISLHVETGAEASRIFDALSEGGEVTTPLSEVAWSSAFGICTDRFGTPWLVLALDKITDTAARQVPVSPQSDQETEMTTDAHRSKADIIALETSYWDAMKAKNGTRTSQLSGKTTLVTGPQGVMSIAKSAMGKMTEEGEWTLESYVFDDIEVTTPTPDVAIIAYTVNQKGMRAGKSHKIRAADSSTWIRGAEGWECHAHSETFLEHDSTAA